MEPERSRGAGAWASVAAAALLLAAGIVAVVALRGSEGDAGVAPAECVSAWNEDRAAVSLGRHQYSDHGYNRTEVTHLDPASLGTGEGDCAVIFPARLLDPEPIAAAMILRRGRWVPLAQVQGVELAELGGLQAAALEATNSTLVENGRIEADPGA